MGWDQSGKGDILVPSRWWQWEKKEVPELTVHGNNPGGCSACLRPQDGKEKLVDVSAAPEGRKSLP